MNTCKETNADGTPCKMKPQSNGLCFAHDPARPAERTLARQCGVSSRCAYQALTAATIAPSLSDAVKVKA